MARIYVDYGNTSLKVYDELGKLLGVFNKREPNWLIKFKELISKLQINVCVLASVARADDLIQVKDALKGSKVVDASCFDGDWCVSHSYRNPENLGIDRLLAMEAAYRDYNCSVLVIDCGSAVTIDYVGGNARHIGGYIVPGYQLQMNSLIRDTSLSFDEIEPALNLGVSTNECIRNGSLRMIHSFCESVIRECKPKKVVLTGGDIQGPLMKLKSLGVEDQSLVFKGLRYVYA